MKRKGKIRRGLAWLLALALCLGMLPGMALAADDELLAGWTMEGAQTKSGIYAASIGDITADNSGENAYITNGTRYGGNGWSEGMAFYFATPTSGYENITVLGTVRASKTGPGSVCVQAKVENAWTNIGERIVIGNSDGTTSKEFSVSGLDQISNQDNVEFRIVVDSAIAGNGSEIASGGTMYIDGNLSVYGTAISGSEPQPGAVAAPQADPQAGEVASGTAITLTCATDGAVIYYTLDGSEPTVSSTLYSDTDKPVITESCTLKAVAIKDGVSSAAQTLQYTIQEDEPQPEAPIADGDQVVIYAPAYNKALSGEYSGFYNRGTDVTVGTDGTLTGYTSADIWTIIDNGDGTWSFSYDDQKLGMEEEHSSMPLGAEYDKWVLEEAADGCWYVKNTGRDAYIEWYADKNNWSAYYNIASGSEGMFALKFYQVTGDTPDPTPEPPIADGDQVVIYAPAYNKALSGEYTGYYNQGTTVTVATDGTLTGYTSADIWTIIDNGDGTWSFSYDDQKLGMEEEHSSMPLGAEYDKWVLEEAADGCWYVKNTGRDAYIEWYADKNNWSAYYNIASGSEGMFALKFYQVTGDTPDPTPEPPIADGDTVVIYAPSNMMALSATLKSQYYPVGVPVEVSGDTITGYGNTEIWTVGGNAENGWTFTSNGGKTLSMAGSYSSVYPGAGGNETWALESAGTADQYYVKNAGRGNYLFWDDEYDDWTTRTEEKTAVTFCVVEPPEEEPEVDGLEVRATPASGASVEAGDTIELTATAGATIYYTTDGSTPTKESSAYTAAIVLGTEQVPAPTSGEPLVIKAIAVLPADETAGTEEQIGDVCTFTYKAPMTLDGYSLYFGQLHSHTNISDGAGSVEEAFAHASEVENLDFLAVTDHSNSFDNEGDASVDLGADLLSSGISSEWVQGHQAAEKATTDDFVGIYGFEMTWSDGFGHINTFNTPGFESRSNSEFGNKSGSTEGYQNYYDKLVEVESALAQFNHPGTTFGDFQDFAFFSPAIDQRITLIEVGNGEGAIGSSGYFPSYEYYTRALDKGWHVAPTNNQDNHKGNWGDSNTARSVVLATALTEDAIYDAIRNYRVYATEDNDLSILYSLNGNAMGSILNKQEDGVTIIAQISDPTDSADMKVDVIVNGGLVIGTQTVSGGEGTVTFRFDSNDYSYYYLRVTQADQNIAVTAPVWTGEGVNAGISKTECDTVLVVKDEQVNLSSELYNNAGSDMTVNSLVFSMDDETIYTADVSTIGTDGVIASGSTATVTFPYAFASAGRTTVNVNMTATIGETQYTFTSVLQLTVTDASLVTRVLVDGTHYNDYVNGYYGGNMGNFTQLAADMNAQVTIQQPGDPITAEDLEDVALLVISAPIKYDQNGIVADESNRFSDGFVDVVEAYVQGGGTLIVCGLADYQDGNDPGANYEYTTYGQINKLLEGIGSTMKVNDDELIDQEKNGGQAYRLYFDDFNYDSADPAVQAALAGLADSGKVYSSYSGCSVYVGEGTAIVYGHDTTYSINSKAPAQGHSKPVQSYSDAYDAEKAVVTKGAVVSLATEAVGEGRVYVGGTVWLSDFEVANSEGNDYGDASYANKTILENILSGLLVEQEVSTIAEAREGNGGIVGTVFTVEGTITAGNVEPNAFYDTIYIQDDTAGINIYPVATTDGTFRVGQRVRVTGSWDQYQGDTELRCISIELIDSAIDPIQPTELTIAEAGGYDANGGLLAQVGGTVKSVTKEGEAISTVILTDGTNDFRLLFNNYIGYSDESSPDITTFVEEGAEISAVGVIYMDPDGVCLRVRDLSEVTLAGSEQPDDDDDDRPSSSSGGSSSNRYTVSVSSDTDHGSIRVNPTRAERGDTVTITVTPDDGYELDRLIVTDSDGDELDLERLSSTRYTFEMPRGRVTVEAVFALIEEEEDQPPVSALPFGDVAQDAWYYDAVQYVYENGLMDGTGGGAFSPAATTTRGMVVTILYRLAGQPAVTGASGFTDVVAGQWYSDAVLWASANGIVSGYGNGSFGPGDTVTREQLAVILYRFAQTQGEDVTQTGALSTFTDGGDTAQWAQSAMSWAVGSGLISGKGNGVLDPQGTATRAEVAAILARFCQNTAN